MDEKTIETCQAFLTVDHGDRRHKLVDLEMVMFKYPTDSVIAFLSNLCSDYDRHLRRQIKRDKSDPRLNEIVARRFRVKMALKTLRNAIAREAA